MKFTNKKVLSMLIAAAMIAVIPTSAFAAEAVSESDAAIVDPDFSVEDIQGEVEDSLSEVLDKISDFVSKEEEAEDAVEEAEEDVVAEEVAETNGEKAKLVMSNDIDKQGPFYAWPGLGTNLPATATVRYFGEKETHVVPVRWTDINGNEIDVQERYDKRYSEYLEWGFFLAHGYIEGMNAPVVVTVHFDKDKLQQPEDPQPEDPKPEDPKPEDPQPEDPKPEDPKPEVTPSDIPAKEDKEDNSIENVQTGESDYAMAWVLFTMSAAAAAVSFSSKKFRIA